MKAFLLQFFTWWNGQTLGTRFYTWRKGKLVGTDEAGNKYYRDPKTDRRWVIYNGVAEASRVPPGWYGWIRHQTDVPPPEETYVPREWQKPHLPNLTGTPQAYRPPGSLRNPQPRPTVAGDYEPWRP
ncbi:MAG: NADH:ubiquinone oxidoreductase subunit NDUFA12 [Bauldia sp.]|nr:NADH:ubiquinone oxidoreductase subunit NDUFA12 [Bauldia sp.]